MIMSDPADKLDPMSLLFYMSSFSVVLLLPTALVLEPGVFGEVSRGTGGMRLAQGLACAAADRAHSLTCNRLLQVMLVTHARPSAFWALLVNSFMAYAVNLTNFLVTKHTSALTLQVCVACAAAPLISSCRRVAAGSASACLDPNVSNPHS
jgi:hypothetical protein